MTLSTTQIENEVEVHRAHVSELIDELRTRVTPGEVLDQFLGWDEGHEIARNFGRQVKNNPLPLALIGTGVAWLMISDSVQRRNGSHLDTSVRGSLQSGATNFGDSMQDNIARAGDSVSDAASSAADYARGTAGEAKARISDTASQISDSASSAMDYGRQKVSDAADGARAAYATTKDTVGAAAESVSTTASSAWQKTSQFTQSASDTIRDTGSNLGRMAQEQPLIAAGFGLAIGMALGALLPSSETENSLLGEQSDAVKQKAGDLASESYEKAKAVAQKSYEAASHAAKEEAENQGLTPESDQAHDGSGDGTSRPSSGEPTYGGNDGRDYDFGTSPRY